MNRKEFMKRLFDGVAGEFHVKNALGEIAWQLKRLNDRADVALDCAFGSIVEEDDA